MPSIPLWVKVSGLTILLALVIVIAVSWILWSASSEAIIQHESNDLSDDTRVCAQEILLLIQQLREDVQHVAAEDLTDIRDNRGALGQRLKVLLDQLNEDPQVQQSSPPLYSRLFYVRRSGDSAPRVLATSTEPSDQEREVAIDLAWNFPASKEERRPRLSQPTEDLKDLLAIAPTRAASEEARDFLVLSLDWHHLQEAALSQNRTFPFLMNARGELLAKPPDKQFAKKHNFKEFFEGNEDAEAKKVLGWFSEDAKDDQPTGVSRARTSEATKIRLADGPTDWAKVFGTQTLLSTYINQGDLKDQALENLHNQLDKLKGEPKHLRINLKRGRKPPFRLSINGFAPEEEDDIRAKLAEVGVTHLTLTEGEQYWLCLYKLHYDPVDPKHFLGYAALTTEEEFHAESKARLDRALFWIVGLCLPLALIAGIAGAWIIMKPLRQLTEAADKIGEGDYDAVELPRSNTREIVRLEKTFERMLGRIRHREARLAAILNNASEGIVITDSNRRIESCNQAAVAIFGYSNEEVQGRKFSELLTTSESRQSQSGNGSESFLGASMQGDKSSGLQLARREINGIRPDGSLVPLEISGEVAVIAEECIYVFVVRDITERKKAEEENRRLTEALRAEKKGLKDQVEARTAELRRTNHRLQKALEAEEQINTAKDVFLSAVSHELRTPLTAVINGCDVLMRLATDQPRILDRVTKIRKSGVHQLGIISDILDFQKMIMGKLDLELEDFEIPPLVAEAGTMIRPRADERNNALIIDCSPELGTMRADRRRLLQILLNLLSNACKFTRDGTIGLRVLPEWETVRFEVYDTGKGIPPDQMNNLFKPFTKILRRADNPDGTGLGLAICKQLAQLMGGDIHCKSELGKGTTFSVYIPVEVQPRAPGEGSGVLRMEGLPEPSPQGDLAVRPRPAPPSQTILVIDDDESVADILAEMLAGEGFSIRTATSGEDGIRLARELHPGLITLDVVMPEKDGWATLSDLKEDPQTADIPVIMLTMLDSERKGFQLGARAFLHKPVQDWDRAIELFRACCYPGSVPPRLPEGEGDRLLEVLIVDDDPAFVEIVREELGRTEGFTSREAHDGRQALRMIAEQIPSLILLDLLMPEMDGFEVLNVLEKDERLRDIPVIVVTAKDLTGSERKFLKDHVRRTFEKGTPLEGLIRAIRRNVHATAQTPTTGGNDA